MVIHWKHTKSFCSRTNSLEDISHNHFGFDSFNFILNLITVTQNFQFGLMNHHGRMDYQVHLNFQEKNNTKSKFNYPYKSNHLLKFPISNSDLLMFMIMLFGIWRTLLLLIWLQLIQSGWDWRSISQSSIMRSWINLTKPAAWPNRWGFTFLLPSSHWLLSLGFIVNFLGWAAKKE